MHAQTTQQQQQQQRARTRKQISQTNNTRAPANK